MRKVRFHTHGGPGALRLDEVPEPVPGAGEVLLRTEVAGVSRTVLPVLRGVGEVPLPASPGGGVVGRVVALGPGVDGLRVGQRVGGIAAEPYAELAVASPALLTPVPEQVGAADALGLVHGGLVALAALRVGRCEEGESVLVTAAAGGVGHLIVQLAKTLGAARVVAAVGSPEKAGFLRSLGADEVVSYQDTDWGGPVDLVLEGAGGEILPRALAALVPFGRLVTLAGSGGTLDAGAVLRSAATVTGLSMGRLARHRPAVLAEIRAELWRLLADGRVRPVSTVHPLERAAEAVALLESRANLGKVVLATAPTTPALTPA
ncbi:zinc-binding alcohol dehydrogenase family protein [Kitasatospora sp. NPDC052896]|uniref:zinc-binding alcohol dehydrogenase family protein n=1 Tax=Kitasatospora sp. NPDC052896 TaxID=3364061 RepID=UPI0037C53477